jgi:hypothetical protein
MCSAQVRDDVSDPKAFQALGRIAWRNDVFE